MVKFEDYVMPAADMGELNPLPDIKNVSYIHAACKTTEAVTEEEKRYIGKGMLPTLIPYKNQDGYNRDKKMRAFKAAVVENDLLKAVFLPELGGRLWSLYDKVQKRELLYVNPVFQPGNLGLRNAWFSGGVEFNAGIKGHNPLTCSPLWCTVDKTPEGDVLRLYEYERIRKIVFSISAWIPENSRVLYLRCRIENPTDDEKYSYWWSNIAVPETRGTRVIVPTPDTFICFYNDGSYLLDNATIPEYQGIDITYPGNIPGSRDFFYKIPKNEKKWIATADEGGHGLLQCSTRELIGRKLFVWGQGQGGRNWNEWLSEEGSAYIEIQAGLARTQLEHIPMKPRAVWEWTEAYTALDAEPEILHGEYFGAVKRIEQCIAQRIGDPDKITFPSDDTVTSTEILSKGSDWGALEEKIRGERISKTLPFPSQDVDETREWHELLDKGIVANPDKSKDPESYVNGKFWVDKLTAIENKNWYTYLQLGTVLYAEGELEKSVQAWEKSVGLSENAWAERDLAMIYKNEYGDAQKAKKYILRAFELQKNCRAICTEAADILTKYGDDELWLKLYAELSPELKSNGRIRLLTAVAYMNLDRLEKAAEIINPDFVMSDIKEGELSVSKLWFDLYRRIYAAENGITYNPDDKELCKRADEKYPLPKKLDFRMHD